MHARRRELIDYRCDKASITLLWHLRLALFDPLDTSHLTYVVRGRLLSTGYACHRAGSWSPLENTRSTQACASAIHRLPPCHHFHVRACRAWVQLYAPTTRWDWSVPANSGTTVSVKTCCIVREERDMHIDPDGAVGAGMAYLLCTQTLWWTVCPAASFHASRTERVRRDYSPFAPATSPHLTSRTPSSQTGKAKGSTAAADGCRATGVCQPFHFRFYPRRPCRQAFSWCTLVLTSMA